MKVALGHFKHVHRQHWGVEGYHRALKQVCHVERFFVRWKQAIRNHVVCAVRAFLEREFQRWRGEIKSWYSLKRHLADIAVTRFIQQRTRLYGA